MPGALIRKRVLPSMEYRPGIKPTVTCFIRTAAIILLLFLPATGSYGAQLSTLSFRISNGRFIIDAAFDNTVTYTVRAENNGASLILRVPSATYTKTVIDRVTMPPNTVMSSWAIKESEGALISEFRLTGPYSYSHTYREPKTIQIEIFGVRSPEPVEASPAGVMAPASPPGKTGNGLVRGVELYNEGRYDEALNEFKDVLAATNHGPLLYYYAAQIRIKKKQFNRAEENLLAALRDSASFADARGLLAYTRLKLGKPNDALADWRSFVASVGPLEEKTSQTVDSIVPPEEYRNRLRRKEEDQRKAEALEKARADSIAASRVLIQPSPAAATAPEDSLPAAAAQPGEGGAETPGALEERIRSNIRIGLYGLSAFAAIIVLFIGGAVILIRRRLSSKADLTFNTEIKRILDQRTNDENLFEDDEDHAASEYRTISRAIETLDQTSGAGVEENNQPEPGPTEVVETLHATSLHQPVPYASRSETITEEVKALVTRMFKEGRSISEIARTADLTQTEIELIVAVRARRMEKLIEDVTSEEDDDLDRDHLYKAISELKYEGGTNRDIARKLSISTSEVQLALSLMAMRKKNRG